MHSLTFSTRSSWLIGDKNLLYIVKLYRDIACIRSITYTTHDILLRYFIAEVDGRYF